MNTPNHITIFTLRKMLTLSMLATLGATLHLTAQTTPNPAANGYIEITTPTGAPTASATGTSAIAMGEQTNAAGTDSIALGTAAQATGEQSLALGAQTTAGDYAIAVGYLADASGMGATAIGSGALANEDLATAIGSGAEAHQNAVALGAMTLAQQDSVAIGIGAQANAQNAVALGAGSIADEANTISVGAVGSERRITHVAAGILTAISTDAVTGAQLYETNLRLTNTGTSAAALFGGATALDTDGTLTGFTIDISGTAYTNVHDALTAINGSLDGGGIKYFHANSTSNDSQALGAESVAIGAEAVAGDYAIAAGYLADASGMGATAIGSGALATEELATAIGSGAEARKDAVALGSQALATGQGSVAIGSQAKAQADNAVALGADSEADENDTVSVGSATLKRRITNVADGALSSTSSDAITGAQLYTTSTSIAAHLGGGSTYNADGTLTAPAYTVSGSTYNNVGTALTVLDGITVQFSGTGGSADLKNKKITNLADGDVSATSTDAVNGKQLYTAINDLTATGGALENVVKYDTSTRDKITLSGSGGTGQTTITNLAAGALSAASTDAVNGSQLYATNLRVTALETAVTTMTTTLVNKHFSTGTDNQTNAALASGGNAVAAGMSAVASGANSSAYGAMSEASAANTVAIGANSKATALGAVAVGQNTSTAAVNAVALGNSAKVEASATGGMALGANAIVMAGATNSVALGAGSVANQSNTVSVGSTGNERRLVNVADATADYDAVNYRQLKAYTNNSYTQLDNLANKVSTLDKRINSVGALGAAISQVQPRLLGTKNQNQLSIGAGIFRDASAAALGYGYTNRNGNRAAGASVAVSSEGDVTGGAGVTFGW